MGNNVSLESTTFKTYAICSSILVTKTLMMAPLTTIQRLKNKAWASEEDNKLLKIETNGDVPKYNKDVERVRRAHLNDLENIPVFLIVGGLYLLTDPEPNIASNLMKVYTCCRIAHSSVYAIYPVPQPTRGIVWSIGYGITLYMAGKVIIHFSE